MCEFLSPMDFSPRFPCFPWGPPPFEHPAVPQEQVNHYTCEVFPTMKGRELLRVLTRQPLAYEVERQKGSHRRLISPNGYPPLTFSFHESATIPRGAVKKVLTKDVGLSEKDALDLI